MLWLVGIFHLLIFVFGMNLCCLAVALQFGATHMFLRAVLKHHRRPVGDILHILPAAKQFAELATCPARGIG